MAPTAHVRVGGVLLGILLAVGAVDGIARAATSDNVAVTSTVGSVLSITDTCSASFDISVAMSGYQADTCDFVFGSTNDATTTLRVSSSAGAFLSGGVFGDHVGGCAALTGDTVGVKVSAVGAGVTGALAGCSVSAAGTNADFVAVPDAYSNACDGTTMGAAANTCTIAVGIRESGGDASSGNYTGTLDLDVIA